MTKHFNETDFEREVLQSKIPVLVDFYAEWCGPCKMMSPAIDKLAGEYEGRFLIGKLDIEANEQAGTSFMVQSIPTIIIFKDGQVVHRDMGYKSEEVLRKLIDSFL